MNRPLRKQQTRSQCRSRLSSLTSLSSHISTGKVDVIAPLRACNFFDLLVFFAPDRMFLNPLRKGVILSVIWAGGPPKVMKNAFCSATAFHGNAALPFVIPTEAKRSGGICSSADLSWKCFSTERSASQIYRITEGLWRGVEGPRRCLLAGALRSFPATDYKGNEKSHSR